jgi:hypothetical protein
MALPASPIGARGTTYFTSRPVGHGTIETKPSAHPRVAVEATGPRVIEAVAAATDLQRDTHARNVKDPGNPRVLSFMIRTFVAQAGQPKSVPRPPLHNLSRVQELSPKSLGVSGPFVKCTPPSDRDPDANVRPMVQAAREPEICCDCEDPSMDLLSCTQRGGFALVATGLDLELPGIVRSPTRKWRISLGQGRVPDRTAATFPPERSDPSPGSRSSFGTPTASKVIGSQT